MPPVPKTPVSQRPISTLLDQLPQCLQRLTLHPPPVAEVAEAVAEVAAVAAVAADGNSPLERAIQVKGEYIGYVSD